MSYDFSVKIDKDGDYTYLKYDIIQNNNIISTCDCSYNLSEQKSESIFVDEIKVFLRDIKNNKRSSIILAKGLINEGGEEAENNIEYKNFVLTFKQVSFTYCGFNIYLTEENLKETIDNLKNNLFKPLLSVMTKSD